MGFLEQSELQEPGGSGPCPAIEREAVVKTANAVCLFAPCRQVLLLLCSRSRGKARSHRIAY
ncbi:protein of unknown function [Pseudomonas sp. JV241A]|nr:protein of unknown function [Pseudomonas sp. JV241A]